MRIVLASASPRRAEILRSVGIDFDVVASQVDESLPEGIEPVEAVALLARKKAEATLEILRERGEDDGAIVIGADTAVECFGEIMGKPRDKDDARRMLTLLCGCGSAAHTGVCVLGGGRAVCETETTYVTFDEMTPEEIEDYVSCDEPYDKAGAYAVQGRAALYIRGITGDYFNVMGLPVHTLYKILKDEFGFLPSVSDTRA